MLLHDRHGLGRKLDAEVAAGYHHAVADLEDVLEVVDGLRLLELGDDVDLAAAVLGQQLAEVLDVAAPPDERRRDVVELVLDGELHVLAVLVGDRRNRQLESGKFIPFFDEIGPP